MLELLRDLKGRYCSLANIGVFVVMFLFAVSVNCDSSHSFLTFEIGDSGNFDEMIFQAEDIQTVGIDMRGARIKVEIIVSAKHHKLLEQMTREHLNELATLKLGSKTLFRGHVRFPLTDGHLGFDVPSEDEAMRIIHKMGRNADYIRRPTSAELESAKVYTEPAKNPWSKKAIYAHLDRDYLNAEKFARKAIETEPNQPPHYAILSAILCEQGKREEAAKELMKATTQIKQSDASKYPGIYLALGELLTDLGKHDEAVKAYRVFLSAGPHDETGIPGYVQIRRLSAHLGLAQVYEKTNQCDLAREEYTLLSESGIEEFKKLGLDGIARLKGK